MFKKNIIRLNNHFIIHIGNILKNKIDAVTDEEKNAVEYAIVVNFSVKKHRVIQSDRSCLSVDTFLNNYLNEKINSLKSEIYQISYLSL